VNGFLKLARPLLSAPLDMEGPRLVLQGAAHPEIVEEQVDALARERAVIH